MRLYLREWRNHIELTQEQLAERMNATKGQVSKLETGKQNWDKVWVSRIAEALNLEDESIIFRDPRTPTQEDLLSRATPSQRGLAMALIETALKTGTKD
jgi:transcriptional regulator with XRE-family HTH domain